MSTTTQCLDNMLIVQPKPGRSTRTGLSLVELLVVIAILLLVTVTAIPLLSASDVQKVRDAAITVNGMISRVKTAAAAHEQRGAGLWLQPLSDESGAVLDMFTSLTLDPYVGDDPESAKACIYKPFGNLVTFTDPLTQVPFSVPPPYNAQIDPDLSRSHRLRLLLFPKSTCPSIGLYCNQSSRASVSNGAKSIFRLIPASSVARYHLPQPYRRWDYNPPYDPDRQGQVNYDYRHAAWQYTTISLETECDFVGVLQPDSDIATSFPLFGFADGDPTPVQQANLSFSIDRPNTRAPTPPLTLPSGYAIDLQWSGWGNKLLRPEVNQDSLVFRGFAAIDGEIVLTEPVQLMFNKDGLPAELVFRKTEIIYLTTEIVDAYFTNLGDIFLLVGRADRCGNEFLEAAFTDSNVLGANWQYPDSRWIRITRATGQVTISEPYPNARTLNESLFYAKAGISAGRG